MKKRAVFLFPLLALMALFTACSRVSPEPDNGQLRILTSFMPVHAHAASIAGDRAVVETLVPENVGVHHFDPRPADMARIARADLLIINGAGIEPWLDDLVRSAGNPDLVVVDLSEGMELMSNPPRLGAPAGVDNEPNPHNWLDPVIAMQQVEILRDALIAADPEGETVFSENAVAYLEQLRVLDEDFRAMADALPTRQLVTFHDAFPYFARRYGFELLGYIAEFPEEDPTPAELASLIQIIRESGVQVLFAEVGYEPNLMQRVARDMGTRIAILDTLEVGPSDADAYLRGMRANLEVLRESLGE